MGACASKPKVKEDAAAPPPISATNADPLPEKPPPPAPKDQGNQKEDGKMLGETEVKLLESAAKTLSENAEQDVPSLKDNMLEGSDQIKKAVEVIKEQVPKQSENPPHESPNEPAQPETKPQATRESQTMPPPQSETIKNESSDKPPMSKTGMQSSSVKENSETKTVSEPEKDQNSLEYLDGSDKTVIDKAVIETAPEKPPTEEKHELGNGVNPDSKEKKEVSADSKIQSNGKVKVEKEPIAGATKTESNKASETTHQGEREVKCS